MTQKSVFASCKLFLILALTISLLAACGNKEDNAAADETQTPQATQSPTESPAKDEQSEDAEQSAANAYNAIMQEMNKAKDGGVVDYDLVAKNYADSLQKLAAQRDSEQSETTNEQISAAIAAAKSNEMDGVTAAQIVDKLLQKVFYTSLKAELKEALDHWDDKDKVLAEVAEAKAFYAPVLENTVKKRDNAFGTHMTDAIAGAFAQLDESAKANAQLDFQLARQVIDKTLMKTFYLAVGGQEVGYAYKVEKAAAANEANVQAEQAEGWAFFQSLRNYMSGAAKEEADLINKTFDLTTDPKTIKAETVHRALVRGLAKVGVHEYEESAENWGQDKAVITGMEGALFINMIDSDIKALLGEESYQKLHEQAENYINAAQQKNKDEADQLRAALIGTLNDIIQKMQ
ncbi:MAG TPA: hypothetical protein VF260_04135 [Bacilli bacterium]